MHEELLNPRPGHKAGFVSLLGPPNVGKSTLMNALLGERLAITTAKAQTTRHRILGILSGEDYQVVLSDTPGILKPAYQLQSTMMSYVGQALEDADLLLYLADPYNRQLEDHDYLERIRKSEIPCIAVLNKIDLITDPNALLQLQQELETLLNPVEFYAISAEKNRGVQELFQVIKALLPEHPPYFPQEQLTDRPERFFTAEMIREKIFLNYKKEIPYSTEVVVEEFKESEELLSIRATIYTERKSQKAILIGKDASALTKTGKMARETLELFFGKKIYLDLYVKVAADWRKDAKQVKGFGYGH